MKNVINWQIPILTGIIFIAIGVFLIFNPAHSFVGLTILFGWSIFVIGGFNLAFALSNRKRMKDWVWYLAIGIFEMIVGATLLFQPGLSAQVLIIFTGFWLLFNSVMRLSFSLILKDLGVKSWWWTLLGAIVTMILSFLVILNPIIGFLTVVYLVAFPLIIAGSLAILFGFQLKKLKSAG